MAGEERARAARAAAGCARSAPAARAGRARAALCAQPWSHCLPTPRTRAPTFWSLGLHGRVQGARRSVRPPPPPPLVLIGHAASLTPY